MQPQSRREGPPANHLVQSPVSSRHTSNARTSQVSKTSTNGNSPASLDNQHFDTLLVKTFQTSVPSLAIWHYGEEFGSALLSLPSCRVLLLPLSVPSLPDYTSPARATFHLRSSTRGPLLLVGPLLDHLYFLNIFLAQG